VGGVPILAKEGERLYNILKIFKRADKEIAVAASFPAFLESLLFLVLFAAVFVLEFYRSRRARQLVPGVTKRQIVPNAGKHAHALKMKNGADTALTLVSDVKDQ